MRLIESKGPSQQIQNAKTRKSDVRVSKWNDTLASKRKAKLDWKRQKADEEEEKRVQIDKEEATLHQRLREETVKRAQGLLYEENDK
eukprot:8314959-Ditylum_brightwellii.AAC.1